jgi:hypothetical protein
MPARMGSPRSTNIPDRRWGIQAGAEPSAGVDIVALDEETAERLLAGDLHPAQAPPGYAGVAVLLAAAAAAPSPDELAGQAAALGELDTVARARRL